jgi:mRNA-decapping enzyme subunit 2
MELEEAPPPLTVAEAMDELHARFLNLPEGEVPTVEMVFYHIQQAHWFYEDEWADQFDAGGSSSSGDEYYGGQRPVLPHLRFDAFSREMFAASPMLQKYCENHADFKARFKEYSNQIPRYGVILLNPTASHVLLIAGMNSKAFGFPKGKVNIGEAGIDCAAREAYEETGYNSRHLLTEAASITHASPDGGFSKLYIAVGVPDDSSFIFAPTTRKEVGGIAWVELSTIQNHEGLSPEQDGSYKKVNLWGVSEYLGQIRAALDRSKSKAKKLREKERRVKAAANSGGGGGGGGKGKQQQQAVTVIHQRGGGGGGGGGGKSGGDKLLDEPLQKEGSWSAKEMFKKNEALLGTKFVYDGNPHTFGEEAPGSGKKQAPPLPTPQKKKNSNTKDVHSTPHSKSDNSANGGPTSTGSSSKSNKQQKAKKKITSMSEDGGAHGARAEESDELPHLTTSDSDNGGIPAFSFAPPTSSSASGEELSDVSIRNMGGGGGGGIKSLAEPFRFNRKIILDCLL